MIKVGKQSFISLVEKWSGRQERDEERRKARPLWALLFCLTLSSVPLSSKNTTLFLSLVLPPRSATLPLILTP